MGYATRGWPVMPTRGKRPILPDWENEATQDVDEIRALWHRDGDWAGYNIGIACGPARLVVLDIDVKDGRDGFAELKAEGIQLPETYSVRTPTGGLHLYYQTTPDKPYSNSPLTPGIDIRAGGGLVVAAGSHIPGVGDYEVASDLPVAALPTALAMRLQPGTGERRKLAEAVPEVIPAGQRETVLVSLAGTMRRRGASPAAILAALEVENAERCEPPLDQSDLERISNSMGRYAPEPDDDAPVGFDPVTVEIDTDPKMVMKLLEQFESTRVAQDAMKAREARRQREVLGGMGEPTSVLDFINAGPDPVANCIWGVAEKGGTMGWASKQGTIIAGPPGTGKSTIALQVILRRVGLLDGDVLGLPVAVSTDNVVYLALDRADQIRQSVRRMMPEDPDPAAIDRLRMIDNLPLGVDLRRPESFIAWLRVHRAGVVVLDSAKDLGFDLNDSADGMAFNYMVQCVLRAGIDVLVTHHSRKTPRGDRKPLTLNDLHGSQWVAAGAGSILMLDGEAGPRAKRLVHVKPLTVPMVPLLLELDAESGEIGYRIDNGDQEEDTGRGPTVADRVMEALAHATEPMIPADIARDLGCASGSVSRAVKQLMDDGRIERDGRGYVLFGLREEMDEDGFDRC